MESEEQLELSQKALDHIVDLENSVKEDDDSHLSLPNLLSQQDDSMNHNDMVEQLNESNHNNETQNEMANSDNEVMITNKEIIEEMREIKKQNRKTHWLLSTLIVLTLSWQLSEVSLLLKLKESLTNPFKSVGTVFKEFLSKRRLCSNGHDEQNHAAEQNQESLGTLPPWPQG